MRWPPLYPRRLGRFRGDAAAEDAFVAAKLIAVYRDLEREIAAELGYWQAEARAAFAPDQAGTIVRLFGATLPDVRAVIDTDVDAAFLAIRRRGRRTRSWSAIPASSPRSTTGSRTNCTDWARRSSRG